MGWRRRYLPSPTFVCLVVAVCVFYQSLTVLWRRTTWSLEAYAADTQGMVLDGTPKPACLSTWDGLYRSVMEFKNNIKKSANPRTEQRAFLYVHPSLGNEESGLYERLLTRLGYTVRSAGPAFLKQDGLLQHGVPNSGDLLIYIPSYKSIDSNCPEKQKLIELIPRKQMNLLPEMQQLLCNKERICRTLNICPEFQNHSVCSSGSEVPLGRKYLTGHLPISSSTKIKEYRSLCETAHNLLSLLSLKSEDKAPSLESPVLRTFVLVTSLSPLRAFVHSTGIVRYDPNRYIPIKLQHFYEKFVKSEPAMKAFNTMKETIGKFLLTLEVLSEASAVGFQAIDRCAECFQLLTVDIVHRNPLRPAVLQVKEHFWFEGLNEEDQITKETIIGNTFQFISQNTCDSIELRRYIEKPSDSKESVCRVDSYSTDSRETIQMLFSFAQELTNPGEFEMVYPSTSDSLVTWKSELYHEFDPAKKLQSISSIHNLLLHLLQSFRLDTFQTTDTFSPVRSTFQNKERQVQPASPGVADDTLDNDTLSHIRRIFSRPQLDLTPEFNSNIKAYYVEVPFDVVTVEVGAEPASCRSRVHLDNAEGPRIANYPLGLGNNQITIFVTDDSKPSPALLGIYRITVHREDRPSLPLFEHYKACGFLQDCGLVIDDEQPCGVRPLSAETLSRLSQAQNRKCDTGDAKGLWIIPCLSCADNRTCDWRAMSWQPYTCKHPIMSKRGLQQCLKDRKVLFIGDSTNRGIMFYLIERVNETLQEWQKSHGMKLYNNVNQRRTMVSYSYYPQFWIDADQRPTFEQALEQLINRSRPLKNTNETILVVGGVQWLSPNHLQIIHNVLSRVKLSDILVIVKSTGMGFHLPVYGIRFLSPIQIKQLLHENLLILETARRYGFEVVDTFGMTMGRYKEFLQGKCGCHFHEVVKSDVFREQRGKKMKLLKNYTFGNVRLSQDVYVKMVRIFRKAPSESVSPLSAQEADCIYYRNPWTDTKTHLK
uniref:Cadherin like and PC-esterase domain containing 1 n=1 Tax=Leptobrachium leishanense TaxID=445787 RepID=A0A8C5MQ50_9ANUR